MKIKFAERGKNNYFWDLFKQMFYVGFYEWDEADYGFTIILFCHEWNWLIYKNKESLFEYQQLAYDHEARYQRWKHDNSKIAQG
jgi:hypothetical protein